MRFIFLVVFSLILNAASYVYEDNEKYILFNDDVMLSNTEKQNFHKTGLVDRAFSSVYKEQTQEHLDLIKELKPHAKKLKNEFKVLNKYYYYCFDTDFKGCEESYKYYDEKAYFDEEGLKEAKERDYYIENVVYINYLKDDLITYCYEHSDYLGGAHAQFGYGCESEFDGKVLGTDVFKDTNSVNKFTRLVANELLKAHNDGKISIFKDTLEDVKANKSFLHSLPVFYQDGIMISFSPYEITPWSDGMIIVFIHKDDLKGLLKDEYFKYFKKEQE
ncbi:DUF3298 domain-containing protein [Campylobacter sp. Cr9]|uniref:DUF3298 domain-containing protein n=1 Tax=Campylobacter sp. Cr9 TaxID=2735728 RepID=UPI003014B79F|nr:DUF3298 domain-containing protein [Campylobacter sp. Cr9]